MEDLEGNAETEKINLKMEETLDDIWSWFPNRAEESVGVKEVQGTKAQSHPGSHLKK